MLTKLQDLREVFKLLGVSISTLHVPPVIYLTADRLSICRDTSAWPLPPMSAQLFRERFNFKCVQLPNGHFYLSTRVYITFRNSNGAPKPMLPTTHGSPSILVQQRPPSSSILVIPFLVIRYYQQFRHVPPITFTQSAQCNIFVLTWDSEGLKAVSNYFGSGPGSEGIIKFLV